MALGFNKHNGGNTVKFGFYWNLAKWEAQIVPAAGGTLDGTAEDRYLRLPFLALVVIAPIMGALYAMFLPFIGFAMVAAYLLGRLRRDVKGTEPPAVEMHPVALVGVRPDGTHVEVVEHDRAA